MDDSSPSSSPLTQNSTNVNGGSDSNRSGKGLKSNKTSIKPEKDSTSLFSQLTEQDGSVEGSISANIGTTDAANVLMVPPKLNKRDLMGKSEGEEGRNIEAKTTDSEPIDTLTVLPPFEKSSRSGGMTVYGVTGGNYAQLQGQIGALQNELMEERQLSLSIREEANDYKANIDTLRQQMLMEREAKRFEISGLKTEQNKKDEKMSQLSKQIGALEKTNSSLFVELKTLKAKTETNNLASSRTIASLTSKVGELTRLLEVEKSSNTKLIEELTEEKKIKTAIIKEKEQLELERIELISRGNRINNDVSSNRDVVKTLKEHFNAESERLNNQIASLHEQLNNKNLDFVDLCSKYEKDEIKFNTDRSDLKNEIAELNEKLRNSKTKRERMEERFRVLKEDKDKDNRRIQELLNELTMMKIEVRRTNPGEVKVIRAITDEEGEKGNNAQSSDISISSSLNTPVSPNGTKAQQGSPYSPSNSPINRQLPRTREPISISDSVVESAERRSDATQTYILMLDKFTVMETHVKGMEVQTIESSLVRSDAKDQEQNSDRKPEDSSTPSTTNTVTASTSTASSSQQSAQQPQSKSCDLSLLVDYKSQVLKYQRKLEELKEIIEKQNGDIRELEQLSISKDVTIATVTNSKKELENEIIFLEEELRCLKGAMDTQHTLQEEQVQHHEEELAILRDHTDALIGDFKRSHEELADEKNRLERLCQHLTDENTGAYERMDELRHDNAELIHRADELAQEIANKATLIGGLQQQCNTLEHVISSGDNKMEELQESHRKEVATLREEMAAKGTEVFGVMRKVEEAEGNAREAEKQVQELTMMLRELAEEALRSQAEGNDEYDAQAASVQDLRQERPTSLYNMIKAELTQVSVQRSDIAHHLAIQRNQQTTIESLKATVEKDSQMLQGSREAKRELLEEIAKQKETISLFARYVRVVDKQLTKLGGGMVIEEDMGGRAEEAPRHLGSDISLSIDSEDGTPNSSTDDTDDSNDQATGRSHNQSSVSTIPEDPSVELELLAGKLVDLISYFHKSLSDFIRETRRNMEDVVIADTKTIEGLRARIVELSGLLDTDQQRRKHEEEKEQMENQHKTSLNNLKLHYEDRLQSLLLKQREESAKDHQEEVGKLNQVISELRLDNEHVTVVSNNLLSQNNAMLDRIDNLKHKLRAARNNAADLASESEAREATIRELLSAEESSRREREQLLHDVEVLREKLNSAIDDNKALADQQQNDAVEMSQMFDGYKNKMNSTIDKLLEENQDLTQALKLKTEEAEEAAAVGTANALSAAKLEKLLTAATAEREAAEEDVRGKQIELEGKEGELKVLLVRLEEKEKALGEATATAKEATILKERLHVMQMENRETIATHEKEVAETQHNTKELRRTIETLEKKLATTEEDSHHLADRLNAIQTSMDEVTKQYSFAMRENDDLKVSGGSNVAMIELMREELKKRSAVEAARKMAERHLKIIEEMEGTVSTIKTNIELVMKCFRGQESAGIPLSMNSTVVGNGTMRSPSRGGSGSGVASNNTLTQGNTLQLQFQQSQYTSSFLVSWKNTMDDFDIVASDLRKLVEDQERKLSSMDTMISAQTLNGFLEEKLRIYAAKMTEVREENIGLVQSKLSFIFDQGAVPLSAHYATEAYNLVEQYKGVLSGLKEENNRLNEYHPIELVNENSMLKQQLQEATSKFNVQINEVLRQQIKSGGRVGTQGTQGSIMLSSGSSVVGDPNNITGDNVPGMTSLSQLYRDRENEREREREKEKDTHFSTNQLKASNSDGSNRFIPTKTTSLTSSDFKIRHTGPSGISQSQTSSMRQQMLPRSSATGGMLPLSSTGAAGNSLLKYQQGNQSGLTSSSLGGNPSVGSYYTSGRGSISRQPIGIGGMSRGQTSLSVGVLGNSASGYERVKYGTVGNIGGGMTSFK